MDYMVPVLYFESQKANTHIRVTNQLATCLAGLFVDSIMGLATGKTCQGPRALAGENMLPSGNLT